MVGRRRFAGSKAQGARDLAHLVRRWKTTRSERERRGIALQLLTRMAGRLLPGYVVTEDSKRWFTDEPFFTELARLGLDERHSADRKFLLRELLKLVAHLPGDTAEAGVFEGASSWLICRFFEGSGKTHYAIDSVEGLSPPTPTDGSYWRAGDLASPESVVRSRLGQFDSVLCKGWIPRVFAQVPESRFCFVHIDVDLYEPTFESMKYFYPRVVRGGVIVCDDFGFTSCPGAAQAVTEYMHGRPEPVLHVPTGQGLVVKR